MKLSIIIVSWNIKELLQKCLESIFEHTKGIEYEVLVVDNNSTDGTKKMLEQKLPITDYRLQVTFSKENLGFAKANNQGIAKASGKYIFLLNPDIELKENTGKILINYLKEHPLCGIVGPQLLNSDGTTQQSVRRFPKLMDQILILLKLHNLFPNIPTLKKYYYKNSKLKTQNSKSLLVEQLMGAAMMIKKEVLEKINGFDEGFKRNFEEVDLCYRAKHAGFEICYVPETKLYHHKGASFKKVGLIQKQRNWNHDVLHYFKKNEKYGEWMLLWIIQWPALILAALVQILIVLKIPGIKKLKDEKL